MSALFPETTDKPHAALVARAVRWLRGHHKCSIAFGEFVSASRTSPDAIGWRMSWSILVECKVSRSDFAADRKKPIHTHPNGAPGQERWYLTPPGLVRTVEVPHGWGLAEAHPGCVRVVVAPDRQFTNGVFIDGRARAEAPILLSAIRRHQLGVPFDEASGRFETMAERDARRRAP